MINILGSTNEDLVAVEVTNEIADEDYKSLIPLIEKKIDQYGSVRLFFELDASVDKIEPASFWQELKFDVKHFNDIDKIAVVGDKAWENLLAKTNKLLTSGEVKYFEPAKRNEAMAWV